MKAHYKVASGRMTFEVEGETAKVLFRELASIQEVFDTETQCGVCHGTAIRMLARKVDKFDFYELACQAQGCRARFAFGQSLDKVSLFPKRKDEAGNWLPNGGWSRYEPQAQQQTQPEPAPAPRPQPVAAPSQVRPQPQAVPMQTGTRNQALNQNQQQAPQYNRNQPRPTEEWTVSDADIPF